jgi:hypothetical protein
MNEWATHGTHGAKFPEHRHGSGIAMYQVALWPIPPVATNMHVQPSLSVHYTTSDTSRKGKRARSHPNHPVHAPPHNGYTRTDRTEHTDTPGHGPTHHTHSCDELFEHYTNN